MLMGVVGIAGWVKGQDCRPQNDSMVLVDFFGATTGTSWKVKWDMNKDVRNWHGVNTNNAGCVTSIELADNGLRGSIPDIDLPFLERFDVSDNNMLSTLPSFSKVPSLKNINVSGNRFRGSLPTLTNSPDLEILVAHHNQLNGVVPDYSHMEDLQILELAENQLAGGIGFILNHPRLTHIDLSNNSFTGSLPDLSSITGLIEVDLSKNSFTGNLPSINNLQLLAKADFSENKITGSFSWPVEVPELMELKISHNQLSDTLPDTDAVGKLEKFHASDNRFTGRIPSMELPDLKEFLLSQNYLTGSVPQFEGLPMLEQFSVRLNELNNIDFMPALLNRVSFVDVSENRMTFEDLVPFRNFRGSSIVLFPQKTVPFITETFTVTKGNNYTIKLDTDEDHTGTDYQWFKDGERINVNVEKEFFISNIIPRDAGSYSVVMTNSEFAGFPIRSEIFDLIVNCPQVIQERKVYLCPGEFFPYKGVIYRDDTSFADTVASQNDFVCDSLYLYDVITYKPDTVHTTQELCEGEIYYFGPDSIELSRSGSYLDTFPNIGGCDSIVMLDLTFREAFHQELNVGVCPGDSLIHGDSTYYTDIDLVDTFTSVFGCDSIVIRKVRFTDPVETLTRYDLCEGDSVLIEGQFYSAPIIWKDTLSARGGCDSISTVQVVVHDNYESTINVRICTPETYEWQGRQLSSSGKYSDTLRSVYGCDSILNLNLIVSPSYLLQDTVYICQGDTLKFNGVNLTVPGIYFSDETTVEGCDSVIVLDLRLREYAEVFIERELCMGDTLIINNKNYTQPGVYVDTFYSEAGCDTLVTIEFATTQLNLSDSTIVGTSSEDSTGSIAVEVEGGQGPYQYEWSNGDTTARLDSLPAGDYRLTVTDSVGCTTNFTLTVPVMTFVWQPVEKKKWVLVRPNYLKRNSRMNIYLDVLAPMKKSHISLFNEMGQEVDRRNFDVLEPGQSLFWELGNYPAGVYYLHIREGDQAAFQVERLIVF